MVLGGRRFTKKLTEQLAWKDLKMDSENKFWLGLYSLLAIVAMTALIGTFMYNMSYNVKYFEAWNICVEAGGQPINQTMLGTDLNTFTCVRK
jgi:hypothetical protein